MLNDNFPNVIKHLVRRAVISERLAPDLGLELVRLVRQNGQLKRLIHRPKPLPLTNHDAGAKQPHEKPMRAKQVTTCTLCKKRLDDPRHGWWHMLACRRVTQQRAAAKYWQRVGYDKLAARAHAARKKRTMEGRVALFVTLAPDAYRTLGRDSVETWIRAQTYPDKRWPSGIIVLPPNRLAGRIRRTYPR